MRVESDLGGMFLRFEQVKHLRLKNVKREGAREGGEKSSRFPVDFFSQSVFTFTSPAINL